MGVYDPKTPKSFNGLSFIMTLVAATLVYFGATFLPHYAIIVPIRGLLAEAANAAYREFDDRTLKERIVSKAKQKGLDVESEDISIERTRYEDGELSDLDYEQRRARNKRGKTITVAYERFVDVKWLFIEKWTEVRLSSTRTVELTQVTW